MNKEKYKLINNCKKCMWFYELSIPPLGIKINYDATCYD